MEAVKLELGCGACPHDGFVHHDKYKHDSWVDVAWDLEKIPWPISTDSVFEILAIDVFEHLHLEPQQWLDECWRVVVPNGLLEFRVPSWNHPKGYGFRDPTHQRVFTMESFLYWCPNTRGSTLYENFGRYYFGAGYDRWWVHERAWIEEHDFRFRMRKLVTE
jgi:SAM-dependent methyltransferase